MESDAKTRDATGRGAGVSPSNKFRSILVYLSIYLASCPLPGSRPWVQYSVLVSGLVSTEHWVVEH